MANRYPLVVNQTTSVIEELQSVDGLEMGNSNIANIGNVTVTGTTSLGAVGNITITGGTTGQVLKTDGAGVLSWGADSVTPGGSNTHVQYNNAGSLGGSTAFTFNSVGNALAVTGTVSGGNLTTSGIVQSVGNVTGGNFVCTTGVLVLNTELATGAIANGTISIDSANNRIGVYYSGAWRYAALA